MNPYRSYKQNEPASGWTRIDLLLALYDKALERLDRAEGALLAGEPMVAVPQLALTQLIIAELAAGVRVEVNPEANTNILRLYEYLAAELSHPAIANIGNARKVLRTLREGFEAVRVEANELERTRRLEPADRAQMVFANV